MSFLGAQNSIALGVQGLIHIDTGGGAGGSADYLLAKSLRFRSSASAYLNRTPATATSQTTWTWSGWVKRGKLGVEQGIFEASWPSTTSLKISVTDTIDLQLYNNPTYNTVWSTTAVFRDPAAWYHVVLVLDTTQASQANMAKLYVNGVQQTFSFINYNSAIAQNTLWGINYTVAHSLGTYTGASYFDGEMAEINFVDGQALAATSFGAFSTYNQWLPIRYAGTYGTNGFYLPFSGGTATSYAGSFNGSNQYLTVPNDAAFTLGATSTTEAWIYVTSTTNNKRIITNGSNTNSFDLGLYNSTNTVFVAGGNANTTTAISLNTWTHVAVVFNSGTLTIYFNGVSQALSGVTTGYSLVASTLSAVFIGAQNAGSYFPGYISNLRVVKGTAVYTANFVPPTAALTAITNTSLLTLQNATIVDNSTNAFTITNTGTVVTSVQSPFLNPTVLTADSSGNGNNWTPNNISLTAGSTYDSLTDVPTLTSTTVANYAVLNPLDKGTTVTMSNGNLRMVQSGVGTDCFRASMALPSTGKWYWEITVTAVGSGGNLGVATQSSSLAAGGSLTGILSQYSGYYAVNGWSNSGSYTAWTTGDLMAVAVDSGTGIVTFYKNGSSLGAIPTALTASQTYFPFGQGTNSTYDFNFGQQPFAYTPPTGFLPLNTFNI